MSDKEVKQYVVRVRVSPKIKQQGNQTIRYKPITYNGVVLVNSRKEIEPLIIGNLIKFLRPLDEPSSTHPIITADEIKIVKAERCSDFFFRKENQVL